MANKKQRDNAAADAEMKAKRIAQAKEEGKEVDEEEEAAAEDMLAGEEDNDVIF